MHDYFRDVFHAKFARNLYRGGFSTFYDSSTVKIRASSRRAECLVRQYTGRTMERREKANVRSRQHQSGLFLNTSGQRAPPPHYANLTNPLPWMLCPLDADHARS